MNGRPDLADAIAVAIAEHGPTSCAELSRIVEARKTDVLRELRSASRFEHAGRGPSSTWRLAGTGREQLYGVASADPDSDLTLDLRDLLTAILTRLGEIERRLALVAPAHPNVETPLAGQIDVYEAIAIAGNGEAPAS